MSGIEDLDAWSVRTESVLRRAIGPDNPLYERFEGVSYSPSVVIAGMPGSVWKNAERSGLKEAVGILEAAVLELEESVPAQTMPAPTAADGPREIFLVHGHDGRRSEVADTIRQLTNTDPVVLHEKPDRGQTIIEKFERHAGGSAFAVILATGDDVGRATGEADLKPRARQNVIFEMGFFIGALGRSSVAVLYEEQVEVPSDYDGVLYIPLDGGGGWRLRLAKELRAAGLEVDANQLK